MLESLFKLSLEADAFQNMLLKSSQISQESTCVWVLFNKVSGPQNCNFIKKRLQHKLFAVNFVNYSKAPILRRGYMDGLFWNTSPTFLRTPFLQNISSCWFWQFQLSSLQLKKGTPAKKFFCEFCKILRTSFDKTPPDDWFLCLPLNFERSFRSPIFYSTSGKLPISCASCRISTTRYNKK